MTKNAKRREQFQKLGQALSSFERDWAVRKSDYQYAIRPVAVADRELSSWLYGPEMRTQQFIPIVFVEAH